jgi:hypothetical protein
VKPAWTCRRIVKYIGTKQTRMTKVKSEQKGRVKLIETSKENMGINFLLNNMA